MHSFRCPVSEDGMLVVALLSYTQTKSLSVKPKVLLVGRA